MLFYRNNPAIRIISSIISTLVLVSTLILPQGEVYADRADKLSPQSVFKPLYDFEKKDMAMLEYVLAANLRSGKWDPATMDSDGQETLSGYDITFSFALAAGDKGAGFYLIPCKCNDENYLCALSVPVTGEAWPQMSFYTAREAEGVDMAAEAYRFGVARRAEQEAISKAVESEIKHDEAVRKAVEEGNFYRLGSDEELTGADGARTVYYFPLYIVYAFLDQVSPKLCRDLKKLVEDGQLMVIMEGLSEPHAGGRGIYLPNVPKSISPSKIIHEAYAKAGFTHDECLVFEKMFTRFVADLSGGPLEKLEDIPPGLPMTIQEKRLLYCAKSAGMLNSPVVSAGTENERRLLAEARDVSFLDLTTVIDRRDYSAVSGASFRDMYETFLSGVYRMDVSGAIIEANTAMAEMLGYPDASSLRSADKTRLFADPSHHDKLLLFAKVAGSVKGNISEWRTAAGKSVWVRENIRPVLSQEGKLLYFEGTADDVTSILKLAEEKQATEECYRGLFQGMIGGAAIFRVIKGGEDFILLDINAAGEKIERREKSALVGRSLREIFPEAADAGALDMFRKVNSTGTAERFASRSYDGSKLKEWREFFIYKLSSGEIVAVYSNETTNAEQREAAIASRTRLRNLIASAPVGIFRTTVAGELLEANPALLRMYGYDSFEDLNARINEQGLAATIYADPKERDRILEMLSASSGWNTMEVQQKKKNGETITVSLSIRAIKNSEGQVAYIEGFFEDISERKKAENELRASERKQKAMLESAPIGFYFGRDRIIDYANERMTDITGYDVKELAGNLAEKLYPSKEEYERVGKELYGSMRELGVGAVDAKWKRKDGRVIYVHLTAAPIDPQNESFGTVMTAIDITERKMAEEQLSIFKRFAENSSQGFGMSTLDGKITYANPALLRLLEEDESVRVFEKSVFDCYPKERHRYMRDVVLSTVIKEGQWQGEFEIITATGRRIPVIESIFIVRDEEGRLQYCANVITDITDRKKAEDDIRKERDRAQRYLNIAEVMIVAILPDQTVNVVNKKVCGLLGYKEEELAGRNWFDIAIPEKERQRTKDVFSSMMKGDIAPFEYFENKVVTKDGRERLIAWHNTVLKDEDGKTIATLSSGEDITDRRNAEEALKASEEELREMFDESPIGIALCDINGNVKECNKAFATIAGLVEQQKILKDNIFTLPPWRDGDIEKLMGGDTVRIAFDIDLDKLGQSAISENHSGKREVSLEYTITPLGKSSGRASGYLLQVRDMTEIATKRKELEEAYEKLKEQTARLVKTHMQAVLADNAATIAHEINNPLQSIEALSEEVDEALDRMKNGGMKDVSAAATVEQLTNAVSAQTEEIRGLIEDIRRECDKAGETVSVQLGYAKPVTGMKPCPVNGLVKEAAKMQKPLLSRAGIELRVEVEDDPMAVIGDKSRLLRVLLNLMKNAAQAMNDSPNKELVVGAKRAVDPEKGEVIRISVHDTGSGMKGTLEENLGKYATQGKENFGTGLGLYITKQVVDEHGGTIRAESALNKGTTFFIDLPAVPNSRKDLEPLLAVSRGALMDKYTHEMNNFLMPATYLEMIKNKMEADEIDASVTIVLLQESLVLYEECHEAVKAAQQAREKATVADIEAINSKVEQFRDILELVLEHLREDKAEKHLSEILNSIARGPAASARAVSKLRLFDSCFSGSTQKVQPVALLRDAVGSVRQTKFMKINEGSMERKTSGAEKRIARLDKSAFEASLYALLSKGPTGIQVDYSRRNSVMQLNFKFKKESLPLSKEDLVKVVTPDKEESQAAFVWHGEESTLLQLVHRAVSSFGGKLSVEEKQEEETVVTASGKETKPVAIWMLSMYIPCERETAAEPIRTGEAGNSKAPASSGETAAKRPEYRRAPETVKKDVPNILIAEDEPAIGRMYQRVLEKRGYNVWLTDNGQEAFDVLEGLNKEGVNVNLAFFDMTMAPPKGSIIRDGAVLVRQVRLAGYKFPIVLASGHIGGDPVIVGLHSEGAISGFVTKPFDFAELETKADFYLKENLPRREKAEEVARLSTERTALVYGPGFDEASRKLRIAGFKGEIIWAKDQEALRDSLLSGKHFDIIINTTKDDIEELIKKIFANLDKVPALLNDIKDTDVLQNKLLEICA